MTNTSKKALLSSVILFAFTSHSLGTVIIAKLDAGRILFVTDTRRELGRANNIGQFDDTKDDECKTKVIGKIFFASSGAPKYINTEGPLGMPSWDVGEDAENVLRGADPNDLLTVATQWGVAAQVHFRDFDTRNSVAVHALANSNPAKVLIRGFFAAWVNGKPTVVWEDVYVADGMLGPAEIQINQTHTNTVRELPYATDTLVDDMGDSTTPLGQKTLKEWQSKSKNVPKKYLERKWLQFLVTKLSESYSSVSPDSDVYEMLPDGRTRHLVVGACHLPRRKPAK